MSLSYINKNNSAWGVLMTNLTTLATYVNLDNSLSPGYCR